MTIPTKQSEITAWLANRASDNRLDIRLPAELHEAIQRYADQRGWRLSYAVKYILARSLR